MKLKIYLLVAIAAAFLLIIIYKNKERFRVLFSGNGRVQAFQSFPDTEFRGMNMLGVNSLDTHIAADSEKECQNICNDYDQCVGYSFYQPGNRCYIYSSGGFVFGRKGFQSGMKI